MAYARAVTFDGVDSERMEQMKQEINQGERPENLPATEIMVLYDREKEQSLVILFFDSDDDYAKGDAVLDAMPADETPGSRTSVTKYEVAVRMTA
jgi:hypothetical protein